MAYTLKELRCELAKALESYVSGTVTSGTTTTIVDTDLLDSGQWADDHFIGSDVYINDTTDDAAPLGEARYCTDFVVSTGTITVGKPFSAAPDASDTYELYTRATVEELNQALMLGVKDWRYYASLSLDDNTNEYTVSADHLHNADQIIGIWLRETNDADTAYYQINDYRVWDNAGVIALEFGESVSFDSDQTCRIEYRAEFSQLKSSGAFLDTATVGGDLALHLLYAKKAYYERKMQGASGPDREWHASMVRYTGEQIEEVGETSGRPASKAKMQQYGQAKGFRFQDDWYL